MGHYLLEVDVEAIISGDIVEEGSIIVVLVATAILVVTSGGVTVTSWTIGNSVVVLVLAVEGRCK